MIQALDLIMVVVVCTTLFIGIQFGRKLGREESKIEQEIMQRKKEDLFTPRIYPNDAGPQKVKI
jgi:hypothetical protein